MAQSRQNGELADFLGLIAANSFARSSFAAGFPLFGVQMYTKLGYPLASTTLGVIALVMTPFRESQYPSHSGSLD